MTEEDGMSAPRPPGGFHLQQQHLGTQLRPELYLPLILQSVQSHCDAPMKGCFPRVPLKSMRCDVFSCDCPSI